jgi:oligoendopeptidase F
MDYKGFNIAVHELGHNVEQVLSLCDVDYYVLQGVPNTAFTEAFAYVFQGNDIMLLGLEQEKGGKTEAMSVVNEFWMTAEIGAVSLIDMKAWRWMYENPDATPAEFREAVLGFAKEVWNAYFADIFGRKDVTILAVYSHMVHSFLYLPDYAIGHMIAFQVKEQMREAGNIGVEFERMAVAGRIAPDLWMKNATGRTVSPDALIEATERALKELD